VSPKEQEVSLGEIVQLIESLESRKGVSGCKYQRSVTDNLIQFWSSALKREELVVLQVLAQYAYYDYSVV
jgi:hypothetical protein